KVRPHSVSMSQPGLLHSAFFGQLPPSFAGSQQSLRLKRWLASEHCVTDTPCDAASICVVAAQHQLLVSCGLKVFATLPLISGLQQELMSRSASPTGANHFHVLVFFISMCFTCSL